MRTDIRALGKPGKHFANWSKTFSCNPELYFEPETVDEIKTILSHAQEKGKKVKAVGGGHSPSDIACTTDFMISMVHLSNVLKVDKEKLRVTVQGGCSIKHLNDVVLPENGMAFSVQGTVSDLTAAGVISTGTHGTGIKYSNISASVIDLEIMLASGEIMTISQTENSELLPIAALSLGSLGIILSVTFQCEKAFNLYGKQYPNTLKNIVENLNIYVTSCDHFRFIWYPHTDLVSCHTYSRTSEAPRGKPSWFRDVFLGFHVLQFLLWMGSFFPSFVPVINRLHFAFLGSQEVEEVNRSDRIFNFDCLFSQFVMEWAIPIDRTGVVLLELKEWVEKTKFPAHLNVEVRFVKGDNIYLSPCYQQDSCYINIIMYRPYNKTIQRNKYWNAFQDICARNGGRPHWAKDHKYTGAEFQALYPKWKEFCDVRKKLDPNGMFLNANLERVLATKLSNSVL